MLVIYKLSTLLMNLTWNLENCLLHLYFVYNLNTGRYVELKKILDDVILISKPLEK